MKMQRDQQCDQQCDQAARRPAACTALHTSSVHAYQLVYSDNL